MERLRVASDVGREYNVLVWSFLTRLGILIGIVFLMTVKPPLEASLIAMATAAGVGLLSALTCFGRRTSHGSMVSA